MNDSFELGGKVTTRAEVDAAPEISYTDLAVFCAVMGNQIRCGVPILEVLIQTYLIAENPRIRELSHELFANIREGEAMGSAMSGYPGIPRLLIEGADRGEDTGNLDDELLALGRQYEAASGKKCAEILQQTEPVRWLTSRLRAAIENQPSVFRALVAARADCPFPDLGDHLDAMIDAMDEGILLSEAMAKRPGVFGSYYVNMIRAGELSGALEIILRRLEDPFAK